MAIVKTVNIKDDVLGYRVINEKDFDPSIHKLATGKEQPNPGATPAPKATTPPATGPVTSGETDKDREEMKELVLMLDPGLASAPGLKDILDEEKYPKERLVELGALMKMERVNPMSYDQFRQKVLESATKLLA